MWKIIVWALLIAPCASWAAQGGGQQPTQSAPSDDGRVVGGHTFIRNGVTAFPLTAPYVNMSLQGAEATIQEQGATQPIKSAAVSPSIIGQFQIAPVSIELGGQFAEIFGADSYSAYVEGANLAYGFSSAVKVEAYRDDEWVLTPVLYYTMTNTIGFSPLDIVAQNIATPDQASSSNLLLRSSDHEVRPELLLAFVPTPEVGFEGELGMGFDTSTNSGETSSGRLGLAIDVNLGDSGIPLGAALFYLDQVPMNQAITATQDLGGGIYEMVNKNFNFGIEVSELLETSTSTDFALSLTGYY